MYQINDNPSGVATPGYPSVSLLTTPTIASVLGNILTYIDSYKIKVTDIENPEIFLHNRQILIETQEYIQKQIARLK